MHCFQRQRPQMPCHVQKSDDLQCRARASNHWHAHTTMFKTAQKPLIIACKCAMENIAQLLVNLEHLWPKDSAQGCSGLSGHQGIRQHPSSMHQTTPWLTHHLQQKLTLE